MELETFRWLLSGPGQDLLARAAGTPADPLSAQAVLRRTATPEQAAAALNQVVLRRRASVKFGDLAGLLYVTSEGLEQATRLPVAVHRAARLAAASPPSLVDLGCGIGGDLLALARAGLAVTGVEVDPLRAAISGANLEALGLTGEIRAADATEVDVARFGAVYADPARRGGRGRSFRVQDWRPPWAFVAGLLTGAAVVKVAPGIPHALLPQDVEAEWVSHRGQVTEAALWGRPLATARRRATVLDDEGTATLTEADDPYAGRDRPVRPVGRYLHEPDGAVTRAGLVTAVAALAGGGLVDPHLAWVTSDEPLRAPYAVTYEVLDELPFRERPLRAALRARGVGTVTVKTRGVDVDPAALRRRLALRGDGEATVVLTRAAGRGAAFLVRPVERR